MLHVLIQLQWVFVLEKLFNEYIYKKSECYLIKKEKFIVPGEGELRPCSNTHTTGK